jgi:hypothetical protein
MEEKNGDNGEKREDDRLKIQQYRSYSRRPLSNHTSDNYQVSLVIYSFLFKHIFK